MFLGLTVLSKGSGVFSPIRRLSCSVNQPHVPVMADEVVSYLSPVRGQTLLDMTFGAGGHTKRLLDAVPDHDVTIFCLDRDPVAHSLAQEMAKKYSGKLIPLFGKFSEVPELLMAHGIHFNSFDGILFDFGCSSMQFDVAGRGFAVSKNSFLDMRMNQNSDTPTAADILANAEENELYKIFKVYGEEKKSKQIARAIIEARYCLKKIQTTQDLGNLVCSATGSDYYEDKLQRQVHRATKVFQALRIFVNDELNEIDFGMVIADKYLKVGGTLVTLSFHSLEDTIVKRHIRGNILESSANPLPLKYVSSSLCLKAEDISDIFRSNWKMLSKHVILPSPTEIEQNPRSRSAKLRAAVKIQ
nr:PREDICTED: probable methyltransferase-like protein 15 homolog [Bemisia tabaci]